MVTTLRKPRPSEAGGSPLDIMSADPELRQAREKLIDLQAQQAELQAVIKAKRERLSDIESRAQAVMAGESDKPSSDIDEDIDKLKILDLAVLRQTQEIDRHIARLSKTTCRQEAPAHAERCRRLAESADGMTQAFDDIQAGLLTLKRASVKLDNNFPNFEAVRLQGLIHQLKPIIGHYKAFLNGR